LLPLQGMAAAAAAASWRRVAATPCDCSRVGRSMSMRRGSRAMQYPLTGNRQSAVGGVKHCAGPNAERSNRDAFWFVEDDSLVANASGSCMPEGPSGLRRRDGAAEGVLDQRHLGSIRVRVTTSNGCIWREQSSGDSTDLFSNWPVISWLGGVMP